LSLAGEDLGAGILEEWVKEDVLQLSEFLSFLQGSRELGPNLRLDVRLEAAEVVLKGVLLIAVGEEGGEAVKLDRVAEYGADLLEFLQLLTGSGLKEGVIAAKNERCSKVLKGFEASSFPFCSPQMLPPLGEGAGEVVSKPLHVLSGKGDARITEL
jgi:hypothetical protein